MANRKLERHARAVAIDGMEPPRSAPGVARADAATRTSTDAEALRVPLLEERVRIEKRLVDIGAIEIRKTVITEQVMVPVELRREEVEIRRVDGEGRVIPASAAPDAIGADTIRIPVFRERAVVGKEIVIASEVVIERTAVTERVDAVETIRRERVTIDDDVTQTRRSRPSTPSVPTHGDTIGAAPGEGPKGTRRQGSRGDSLRPRA